MCTQCPTGQYLRGDGDSSAICNVTQAFAAPQAACTMCPAGQYQNMTGQSSCVNCPPNFFGSSQGSNSSNCPGPCPAGTYCPGGCSSATPLLPFTHFETTQPVVNSSQTSVLLGLFVWMVRRKPVLLGGMLHTTAPPFALFVHLDNSRALRGRPHAGVVLKPALSRAYLIAPLKACYYLATIRGMTD